MSVLIKVLKWFYYLWSTLLILSIIVGIVGILLTEGFVKVMEIFSPFNWINYFLILILWSPAIGAYILVRHLEKKVRRKSDS